MVLAIHTIKADADRFYADAMTSSKIAEQARADFYRLRAEHRQRAARRGVQSVDADRIFSQFQVAKDCIDTEQMHGRWSRDRFAAANAAYAQVTRLQMALSGFMRQSAPKVPAQREGE